jgi:hypothetical protein
MTTQHSVHHGLKMCTWSVFAVHNKWLDNSERTLCFSSETLVRNIIKGKKHIYFHHLNGRKISDEVFNSTASEGLQNLELDNYKCTLKANTYL